MAKSVDSKTEARYSRKFMKTFLETFLYAMLFTGIFMVLPTVIFFSIGASIFGAAGIGALSVNQTLQALLVGIAITGGAASLYAAHQHGVSNGPSCDQAVLGNKAMVAAMISTVTLAPLVAMAGVAVLDMGGAEMLGYLAGSYVTGSAVLLGGLMLLAVTVSAFNAYRTHKGDNRPLPSSGARVPGLTLRTSHVIVSEQNQGNTGVHSQYNQKNNQLNNTDTDPKPEDPYANMEFTHV